MEFMMSNESIEQRIDDFRQRFGEAHVYFACHAAFPLSLTPDLAYRLWMNFQRDVHNNVLKDETGRVMQIPWIAVADLLLSNLCEEVAHELYEIKQPLRNELLKRLRRDERFGKERLMQLARFLEAYFQQHLHSSDPYLRNFANAQKWIATAYTAPHQVFNDLAQQLKEKVEQNDKAGTIHYAALVETIADSLIEIGLEPFITYSRFIDKWDRGKELEAQNLQKLLPLAQNEIISVAEFDLPMSSGLFKCVSMSMEKSPNQIRSFLLKYYDR